MMVAGASLSAAKPAPHSKKRRTRPMMMANNFEIFTSPPREMNDRTSSPWRIIEAGEREIQ
jgi:hypothetical protein